MESQLAGADAGRYALLNHLVSYSKSRNRSEYKPPTHDAFHLLQILEKRFDAGFALEHLKEDPEADDKTRLLKNKDKNYIRIKRIHFSESVNGRYCALLIEYYDQGRSSFPVVDRNTLEGRELTGGASERGAVTIHIVIKMPLPGITDDGKYRCVLESLPSPTIPRALIEHLFCRQLRRVSDSETWDFPGKTTKGKRKEAKTTRYRYTPRLELHSDVGRKLNGGALAGRQLSMMTFTKRDELLSTGQPTGVKHTNFRADMTAKVKATEGPDGEAEKVVWFSEIRQFYESRGYKTTFAFRNLSGGLDVGSVQPDLESAADILMCRREPLKLSGEPKLWSNLLDATVIKALTEVLDRDDIWDRVG